MNYFLDVGNSKAKLVSFDDKEWKRIAEIEKKDYPHLKSWLQKVDKKIEHLKISSVVPLNFALLFDEGFSFSQLTIIDIPATLLDYDTPETLGIDRFLACYGALSANKQVIVIDAGTAVTIDLMDENGVFKGGVIAPGLKLFEQGLHHYAPALPLVPREIPELWPPKSTKTALEWGISGGFVAMISGFVQKWKQDYPDAEIWCSGGDGEWISEHFKNAYYDAFLVPKGLHRFPTKTV